MTKIYKSKTLQSIIDHMTVPWDGQREVDFPFDLQKFCQDNDEKLLMLDECITLLYEKDDFKEEIEKDDK